MEETQEASKGKAVIEMRKRAWLIPLVAGSIFLPRFSEIVDGLEPPPHETNRTVAAPGVVEPGGEEFQITAGTVGILEDLTIKESDQVVAGQVIAIIANEEQRAKLKAAQAELEVRRAVLNRAVAGARAEEKRQTKAALLEAESAVALAERDYERRLYLLKKGFATPAAVDLAKANKETATARRMAAIEKVSIIEAGSRQEDIDAARADVDLAEANVALAIAQLNKSIIKSPISGTVLRLYRHVGELVGLQSSTPVGIVGDLKQIAVRAQLDEKDISRVKIGDRAEIKADAYPDRVFYGTTISMAPRLGPKTFFTDRPTERSDTKVLETIVNLDAEEKLPVGLRVEVYFKAKGD